MPRFINSDTRKVVVIPVAGIADPTEPTATELNAGVDITCAVVDGYTLGPTASDAISENAACDTANSSAPGRDNYEANLTLFRPDDTDAGVYDDAKTALAGKGTVVWIAERISSEKGAADTFATADVLTFLGRFVLDNQLAVAPDAGYEKFSVQPMQDGYMAQDVAVAAGA